jgi:hypothetical protein
MRELEMKVARKIFLGGVVGVLLITILLTLRAQAASHVSPKTSTDERSPATSMQEKVVNADDGVYWRSDPDWNTPLRVVQQGIYTGDTVALACYTRGNTVPPYNNNPLWYWAEVVAGHGQGSGWVNDHFLNTGTNQPDIPVNGVDPCPAEPYIWSHTSDGANVRSLPEDSSPKGYLDNDSFLNIDCWIDGGWMTGDYRSNIWFHNQPVMPGPPSGYIHASLIANLHTLPQCSPLVTLAEGPRVSNGIYQYAITLSGFPANISVSVVCYDSARRAGFSPFTMTTDGMGNGSNGMGIGFDKNTCSSDNGPDHWVVVEGLTSNIVQWGGGSPTPLAPTVTPTQPPAPTVTPTQPPAPTVTPTQPPAPTVTPTQTPTTPPPPPMWAETAGGVAHTWTNYQNAGGYQGQSVAQYQTIQIACKITGFVVADSDPWWYRIAQTPWNNTYYVSADAFYNNGATSGSLLGTPWVDPAVPNC